MISFVRRHRLEALLVLLAVIAVVGSTSLQDWGAWAAIIAAAIALFAGTRGEADADHVEETFTRALGLGQRQELPAGS